MVKIHIYILDTGINQHSEFTGRLGTGKNFVNDRRLGIVTMVRIVRVLLLVQNGSCKQATLHAVRVLDCSGSGSGVLY